MSEQAGNTGYQISYNLHDPLILCVQASMEIESLCRIPVQEDITRAQIP